MRKNYLLLVVLVSLLLVGCLGGRTSYVYDGSPTALDVVIKREGVSSASTFSAMATEPETTTAKARIWRTNSAGQIVYSVFRDIPINSDVSSYSFSEELPAQPGYSVTVMHANHQGFFEVGSQKVDAPAERLTTANITLAPLNYTLIKPNEMYSGGFLGQFDIVFPGEFDHLLDYYIRFGFEPWLHNGNLSGYSYSVSRVTKGYLPEVTSERELYYQVVIMAKDQTYSGTRPVAYFPDLNEGSSLPSVTVYPE